MGQTLQILTNGLISGLDIGLLALAFQLVYMTTRVFFVGLAGLFAVAPFILNGLIATIDNGVVATILTLAVIVGLAMAMEVLNHRPLFRQRASDGTQFISSLGLYILLMQAAVMIVGNDSQQLSLPQFPVATVVHLRLTVPQIATALLTCIALAAVFALLRYSALGLRMRALSDNADALMLYGYDIEAIRLAAFVLGGGLAAIAALTTAYDVGFDAHTGLAATSLAIAAVFTGGRRSFVGPVVGGLIIGIVRAQVAWHFDARWQDGWTFMLMGIVILLRPDGLFGRRTRLEESYT